MTLSVHVYRADANGTMLDFVDDPKPGAELAGIERWRTSVWGSEAVRSLGARFFPQLADGDLYVATDQLPAFLEECALLRSNLTLVAGQEASQDTVSHRLGNIEAAATRAVGLGACVVVW